MARNRLLAIAAGIGVVAAVVLLAGTAHDFSNVSSLNAQISDYGEATASVYRYGNWVVPGMENPHLPMTTLSVSSSAFGDVSLYAYLEIEAALDLAGAIFLVLAFVAAASAFLRPSQVSRRRLLATSAGSLGLSGGAALAAGFIGSTVLFPSEWAVPASYVAEAGSGIALIVAATFIRTAVRSGVPPRRLARGIKETVFSPFPSRPLAWGCGWLAAYFALKAADVGFNLGSFGSAIGQLPGSLSGGLVTETAGAAVAAVGAAIAAFAFSGRTARRDAMLGVAAIGIGLGFLIIALGLFLQALYSHDTSDWLEAISWAVLAVAAGCGAAAFLPRLEKRHGSDITAMPNPA